MVDIYFLFYEFAQMIDVEIHSQIELQNIAVRFLNFKYSNPFRLSSNEIFNDAMKKLCSANSVFFQVGRSVPFEQSERATATLLRLSGDFAQILKSSLILYSPVCDSKSQNEPREKKTQ